MPMLLLIGLGMALLLLWFSARNAITVAVLSVHRGKVRVTRGGIAPRILADVADVVSRPPVEECTLRIQRRSGRAELHISGNVGEAQQQQLRNVIGSLPLSRLSNTRRRI